VSVSASGLLMRDEVAVLRLRPPQGDPDHRRAEIATTLSIGRGNVCWVLRERRGRHGGFCKPVVGPAPCGAWPET
jgi:hypothetical protein